MCSAMVFNIQRFSVHDGPGIRTTIFLKGCNLRCAWCHNPESFQAMKQLQFFQEKCTLCGACMAVCPENAHSIEDGSHKLLREKCVVCGKCAEVCMQEALTVVGKEYSVRELIEIVKKDKAYYQNSGGGMTLSGGEPLLQSEAVIELLCEAKKCGIGTAVDTALAVDQERVEKAAEFADLFLVDIKFFDAKLHKQYTGVDNKRILQNIRWLLEQGKDLYVRIPIIGGVNDTPENAQNIAHFLEGFPNVIQVELLPYHTYGLNKAKSLDIAQKTFTAPDSLKMEELKDIFRAWGIHVAQ